MLTESQALLAAHHGRPGEVAAPLNTAAELAERFGTSGEIDSLGFLYAPLDTAMARMWLALEAGDPGQAVSIAGTVRPEQHPHPVSQAHCWIFYGRGLVQPRGRRDDAVWALRTAEDTHRTKELVAADLPDKQEQILEVELEPRHRSLYQRHLQRERQKVLGLIDGGHRALVFSRFTGFLAHVRERPDTAGIAYCYLDGSTRLIAKDTIEEKVRALADRKAELFSGVMDEGNIFGSALDAEDIRALLAGQRAGHEELRDGLSDPIIYFS